MDNPIMLYQYEGRPVRTFVPENGEPVWVAKDVCEVLGIRNSRDALSRLDDDQKGVVLTDTPGGDQKMATVNESGLYELIIRSDKPEARKFRKWITSEVLPQIRKTGGYQIGQRDLALALESLAYRLSEIEQDKDELIRLQSGLIAYQRRQLRDYKKGRVKSRWHRS